MKQLQGKYNRRSRYYAVRAQRAVLRAIIRPLAGWEPMASAEDGYSIILGCTHRLWQMLSTNLLMLSRQDLTGLKEVIVVVDTTREALPANFERQLRDRYPALPLQFHYYSPRQVRVTGLVRWAWVYAWLSWCIGIGATRTRYALLHDFDAMLVGERVLRERYERLLREPIDYLGVRHYVGNGVRESDGLVTTFEMMFDCSLVRHHFKPIDLFNHVCRWRGRTVDFDTFLYAQSRLGSSELMPLDEGDMVHPSQMICQFTELMNGRELNPTRSALLLIPYFLSVCDDASLAKAHEEGPGVACDAAAMMGRITEQLSTGGTGAIDFFGRTLQVHRISDIHAEWLAVQATRLDRAVFGKVRPEVRAYFAAINRHVQQSQPELGTAHVVAHAH